MIVATDQSRINYQRIEQAIRYLQHNFKQQPELDEVAEKVHLSPFHFQRMFREWVGISPKRFLQYLTTDYLKQQLLRSDTIDEAAEEAGLSSQSRVYDLFTTLEAVTPGEYRERGAGIRIAYGFHATPFGRCLLGVTPRGICWLSFISPDEDYLALAEMKTFWYNSAFYEDENATRAMVQRIFHEPGHPRLHLFVKGTNFQVKVWEALLSIPAGRLTTYQDIARRIDHPGASRAVGSAVGSNTIAYLIPCHRVIRKDGEPGDYRWNAVRKKSMIGWELAKASTPNSH